MSTIIGTLFLLVAVNYCCYISTTLNTDDYNNNHYNLQQQQQQNNYDNFQKADTIRSASDNDSAILINSQTNHEEDTIKGDIFIVNTNTKTDIQNNNNNSNDNENDTAALARGFYKLKERWRSMRRQSRLSEERLLRQSIKFIYYKNNDKTHETVDDGETTEDIGECKITDKFAFILHGWRQSCEIEWMPKLIERLSYYRGGCIVCIDYSVFAKENYMVLYRHFKIISQLITLRLIKLIDQGWDPAQGYMFGFSYGGQLATAVGQTIASTIKPLKSIDTCDMAGPGFDLATFVDHRGAAENVQCLHTSRDKGTRIYSCHQNIRLGNCGWSQPAVASQPTYSSHGLCVQIYINAFDYKFSPLPNKPPWCLSRNPAIDVPQNFAIGYSEVHDPNVSGEIFVPTGLYFPYNDPTDNLRPLNDLPPLEIPVVQTQRRLRPKKRRRP